MVLLKDLIIVPNIAQRLKITTKTNKVLEPHKDAWSSFTRRSVTPYAVVWRWGISWTNW